MPDKTRSYRMQRRAQSQQQTRQRITESAMELHGTLGPSRTSISAVAELAGVRRSTVYRHFPDEASLFDACSAQWAAANPPPDLGAWSAIDSPDERLRVALCELYAFYGRTDATLENLFRDEPTMPAGHCGALRRLPRLLSGRTRRADRGTEAARSAPPTYPSGDRPRDCLLHLEVPCPRAGPQRRRGARVRARSGGAPRRKSGALARRAEGKWLARLPSPQRLCRTQGRWR